MEQDYYYKCVPASQSLNVGKKGNENQTANAYAALISEGAKGGWEFVDVVTTNTFIPSGCLSSLFGSKGTNLRSNILVFKKRQIVKNTQGQVVSEAKPYNDSNLLSELNINKMEILEQMKAMHESIDKLSLTHSKVSSTSSTSTPAVKRMTMEEYQAKKAAEEAAKNT